MNKLNKYLELIELISEDHQNPEEYFQSYIQNYNVIINEENAILYRLLKWSEVTSNERYLGETNGIPDTIMIDYLVGNLSILEDYVTILPLNIHYVSFLRDEEWKIYPIMRFLKKKIVDQLQ